MNTFAQVTREQVTREQLGGAEVTGENTRSDSQHTPAQGDPVPATQHPARAAQQAMGAALNRSPAVQAQGRIAEALNRAPRVVAQLALAEALAQRAVNRAPQVQRRAEDNESAAAQLATRVTQRHQGERDASSDRRRQARTDIPLQPLWGWLTPIAALGAGGGAALGATLGSFLGPAGTIAGGVAGGVIGGVLGGAATILGGLKGGMPGAGATLGLGAGAYYGGIAGSALGPIGAAGGAVLGGALGATAGLVGGAHAKDLSGGSAPEVITGSTKAPTIGSVMVKRAMDMSLRGKSDKEREQINHTEVLAHPEKYFSKDLAAMIKSQGSQKPDLNAFISAIDYYYQDRHAIAASGQYAADTAYNADLTKILLTNPFIQKVLNPSSEKERPEEKKLDEKQKQPTKLTVPLSAPPRVFDAAAIFNNLVDRPEAVSGIKTVHDTRSPGAAMGHHDDLHLGPVSPTGSIVHEFGHQLEYNLSPTEFGSLHNFLRARSRTKDFPTLRKVGYPVLAGARPNEEGYDIEQPPMDLGASSSLVGFLGDVTRYQIGDKASSAAAEDRIGRFMVQHGSSREASYSSTVREEAFDTEYLSTTIEFFTKPGMAKALVETDPLRACLFLSFAQPAQYHAVSESFAKLKPKPEKSLDQLMHKIA